MCMRTRLSIAAVLAVTAGCTLLPHRENGTSEGPPHLVCGTGIAFRDIDNHTQHDVRPGWEVIAQLTARTTYGRRFDWQNPTTAPDGVLRQVSVRQTGDGGLTAVWRVETLGKVHVAFVGKRLSSAALVRGEKEPSGLYELALTSVRKVPGSCHPVTGVVRG
jgi:hypothetical protein